MQIYKAAKNILILIKSDLKRLIFYNRLINQNKIFYKHKLQKDSQYFLFMHSAYQSHLARNYKRLDSSE